MPTAVPELLALDRAHVWHPYGPMPGRVEPLVVESASGVTLEARRPDGSPVQLIDGMSSWWAVVHGYRNPHLDAALREQAGRMSHVMFGGLTHAPAVELATRLVRMTPEPLEHVFLADSGSIAVEVAIKMCMQYWVSTGHPEKRRLMTWRGGYHGDTFHAMSVCDPEGGMHSIWQGTLPRQVFAPIPPKGFDAPADADYIAQLDEQMARHAHELAAVIVEPVVQGAGGMRFHHPEYVRQLRELTRKHGVLLILDEIATAFGRTGALFAMEHAGVVPDVLCLGKALTGGYATLAAAICTPQVAQGISQGEVPVLAHGPTFMGNPLACAVANAALDLIDAGAWRAAVPRIEQNLARGLEAARELPTVTDVRVLGAIGVVELDHEVDLPAATRAAVDAGVWLRPFRNLIYTMPQYIADEDHIARICAAIHAAARVG